MTSFSQSRARPMNSTTRLATTWADGVLIKDTTTGTLWIGDGSTAGGVEVTGGGGSSGQVVFDPGLPQRFTQIMKVPGKDDPPILSYFGCRQPVLLAEGASAVSISQDDKFGAWWTMSASSTSGNRAGLISDRFEEVHEDWDPIWMASVVTSSAITSMRMWSGITSGDPSGQNDLDNLHFAGFWYDSAVGGNLQAVTNDGAADGGTVTDLGITVGATTRYDLRVEFDMSLGTPEIRFYVNVDSAGWTLEAKHTTNLPSSADGPAGAPFPTLGYVNMIEITSTGARAMKWATISVVTK